jgi:hypothetical protein
MDGTFERRFEAPLGQEMQIDWVVLDNMATAVLGRWGPNGQPVWHPRFPLKIRRLYRGSTAG